MSTRIFVGTLALGAVCLADPAGTFAGPWTKSAGEAYLKLSGGMFLAGEYVGARVAASAGDIPADSSPPPSHTSLSASLYGEVGLADRLHAQLYFPFVRGQNDYGGGYHFNSAGAGDLVAALQWTPGVLSFPHALRAELKLPLYDLPHDERFPARGDGQVDATLWLSAGSSFSFAPIYAFAELGHRFRTEAYPTNGDGLAFGDCFVFQGQIGLNLGGFVFAAGSSGVVPYDSDAVTKGYATAGGALSIPIAGRFAFELSADAVLWAKNSSRGFSASGGFSYSL